MGIGYNRVNDSEKKIIEEINNLIDLGKIPSEGELVLYSKWEPCPSCYYVISQFKAETFTELFDNTKALEWENYIPKNGNLLLF